MSRILSLFRSKTLARASVILASLSLVAKLTGLLRDRVLAGQFGASTQLDIYYSAFKLPDLVFNLFILGAVSSAFIPVFIEHYQLDERRAWRLAQNVLNVGVFAVFIAAVILFAFAGPLASVVAPGFSGADRDLLIRLIRLMLLSPIIFSMSTVFGAVLQALERFAVYAAAPILYNLGIIVGALYVVPVMRSHGLPEVFGLGIGVIIGAFGHFFVQMPAVLKAGFRFGAAFDIADQGLRKIFRLMIPRTIGIGAYSVESLVMNAFASLLGAGSIAIFNFANNLQFVPISVLGLSVATAVFPRLSSHAAQNERQEFHRRLSTALKRTSVIVGIVAILMLIFREQIIKIIFQTGAFRSSSTAETAAILGIFMFGVVAQSLVPVMSRAFYAMQNTRTPVIISLIAIATNIILASIFVFLLHWNVRSLAFSYAIAGNVNFFLLYIFFRRRYS